MRILILSAGNDPAGISYLIERAFARHAPDWQVRTLRQRTTYLAYPQSEPWDDELARELYRWADVVHHHNTLELYPRLDRGQRKPAVLHHHGSRLRRDASALGEAVEAIGAVELVATLDLLDLSSRATWLPAPIHVDAFAPFRTAGGAGPVRVVHAPTDPAKKGTASVVAAVRALQARHDVELDVIQGVSWRECLGRKGQGDLLVDQFELGYGHNALEAWAMGLPVVSGVHDPGHRGRMLERWGELPFVEASPGTLVDVLEGLVVDPALRSAGAEQGLAHVRRWHDPATVVAMLQEVYASAPRSSGRVPASMAPRGTGPRRRVVRALRSARRRLRSHSLR